MVDLRPQLSAMREFVSDNPTIVLGVTGGLGVAVNAFARNAQLRKVMGLVGLGTAGLFVSTILIESNDRAQDKARDMNRRTPTFRG